VEEISYNFQQGDKEFAIIDIYLEDSKERVFKYSITLENEEIMSRTGKSLYINSIADTQWVDNEDQLWDSFKYFEKVLEWEEVGSRKIPKSKEIIGNKDFHIAKIGEPDLLHFLRRAQDINPYNPENHLFVKLDKLFGGDFRTIERMVEKEKDFHLVAFAYVDDEGRQKIWKEFLPLNMTREINNGMQISSYNLKIYNDWKKTAEGEYGIDGHYVLDKIQLFRNDMKIIKKEVTDTDLEY
jgi:hypothetical protein